MTKNDIEVLKRLLRRESDLQHPERVAVQTAIDDALEADCRPAHADLLRYPD